MATSCLFAALCVLNLVPVIWGILTSVVVGGIIPEADQPPLREAGVARVYTPKDYALSAIMADIVELTEAGRQG